MLSQFIPSVFSGSSLPGMGSLLLHTLGARGELSAIQKPPTTFVDLWIKSATNIPQHDGVFTPTSHTYPYVYVSSDVFGLEKVYVWRTNSAESTPHWVDSTDPSWNQQDGTAASLPLPATGTMGVEFWDHDDTSQTDEFIGVTTIDIASIINDIPVQYPVTSLSLPAPLPNEPTTATVSITTVPEYGAAMLQIVNATNLLDMDGWLAGESDPYVIVKYDGSTLLTTAVVDDNLHPVWPQQGSQVIIPKLPPTGSYVLEIWDDDGYQMGGEEIGTVTIPVSSILDGSTEGDHAYPVEGGTGELTVRINKAMYDNAPMVSVRVHGATGLNENMDTSISGSDYLPDPYLRMHVNLGTTAATRHQIFESVHSINNARNPTWTIEEASRGDLKLPVPGPGQEFMLEIEILDSDHVGGFGGLPTVTDWDPLGWVRINIAQIMQGDPTVIGTHTYSVTDETGVVNPTHYPGQLTVQIDPMYNFPACDRSAGKYRDLTSKACVSCGPDSVPEPVTATEDDSTACVCTPTEQEWIAATNECAARCPDSVHVWDPVLTECVALTSEPTRTPTYHPTSETTPTPTPQLTSETTPTPTPELTSETTPTPASELTSEATNALAVDDGDGFNYLWLLLLLIPCLLIPAALVVVRRRMKHKDAHAARPAAVASHTTNLRVPNADQQPLVGVEEEDPPQESPVVGTQSELCFDDL